MTVPARFGSTQRSLGGSLPRSRGFQSNIGRYKRQVTLGGLLKPGVAKPTGPQGTNAYTCSVEVADFDATAEKIASLGGIVAMAKFAIPGKCWQGYFIDTEGNVFGIFQVDEKAGT